MHGPFPHLKKSPPVLSSIITNFSSQIFFNQYFLLVYADERGYPEQKQNSKSLNVLKF